jgi:hypothetical protein
VGVQRSNLITVGALKDALAMKSRVRAEVSRQLPRGEEIFLDHVGHFVRDPEAASRALARAGFAPTPVSIQVHPDSRGVPQRTGTGNVTAMFARGYIEALFKSAETPLGRELESAMARYPGVHLVAFSVAEAAKEHRRLAETGFRVRPLVALQRPVETADGSGTAAFTVARIEPREMPEGRIQMLTHHTEDTVWQPRWLSHPNGALGLTSVTIVVADVDEAAARFARFTARAASRSRHGQRIALDRGQVDLVSAEDFGQVIPDIAIPSLPFIGAYGIKVKSLDAVEQILMRVNLKTRQVADGLLVQFPEELGLGVWSFAE